MLALALALVANVGPLSALVFAVAAGAVACLYFAIINRWAAMSGSRRAIALGLALAWISIVVWGSSWFWLHPKVYSDRLTTTYRNLLKDSNFSLTMSQGEIFYLAVSANLHSEDLFNRLRSDLRQRFGGEQGLHIHWDVKTADGKVAIYGFDREWFPEENSP